jgi:hypothetical protein
VTEAIHREQLGAFQHGHCMDNHCDLQHFGYPPEGLVRRTLQGICKFQLTKLFGLPAHSFDARQIHCTCRLLGHGRPFDSKQPPLLMPIKAGLVACA